MSSSSKIHKPNFFLLGAAKSGTTFLYQCLQQHPEIYMPRIKEPSFFCNTFQVIKNPVEYISLFQNVKHEKAIGDASHVYLTCPDANFAIHAFFPDAKFILILRNPTDRAYSLYHHMVYKGFEWINSFEAALIMEQKRIRDEKFKAYCPHYFYNYLYFHSGIYSHQIEQYLQYFHCSQFLFITFDEFRKDKFATLKRIYHFLNVDQTLVPEQAKVFNKGYSVRSARLQFLLMQNLVPILNKIRFPKRSLLTQYLKKINRCSIPPMNSDTRKHLQSKYNEDIKKVELLIGLDLKDWILE